jgi:uncharacterized protein (TIGR02996 family)
MSQAARLGYGELVETGGPVRTLVVRVVSGVSGTFLHQTATHNFGAHMMTISTSTRPQVMGFLAEIKANPDDDTPRLILADWLDDHDDPERAEFLRLQCRVARCDEADPDWADLRRREQHLLERYRMHWLGELRGRVIDCSFHRGLLRITAFPHRLLSKVAENLADTEALGWVEELRLGSWPDSMPERLASPILGVIPRLDLSGLRSNSFPMLHLAKSTALARLSHLNLSGTGCYYLSALTKSPHLQNLRELRMSRCYIGSGGTQALAKGPCSNLKVLDLTQNNVASAGVDALSRMSQLASLTHLDLAANVVQDDGATALGRSPHLTGLAHLDLGYNGITEVGVRALASSPQHSNLTDLNLTGNHIGPGGAAQLASWSGLAALERLNMTATQLGNEGAIALAGSLFFGRLTRLYLTNNQIGTLGVQALAASPGLSQLVSLNLASNWIGSKGILALSRSPHLLRLRALNLAATHTGARGIAALLAWPGLHRLTSLSLRANRIDDAQVLTLAACPGVANLTHLDLACNSIGPAGSKALAASPYLTSILELDLRMNHQMQPYAGTLRERFGDRVLI